MRWSYLLPRLILVALIWAFFYFAFDPLLKWGLIKGLENVFEAKVEIKKVKTSFINPTLEVYGFAAGNSSSEYKNLFEFERLRFKLNGKQLLEKKFIIEEGSIKGLNFDTDRKTSCKIYIPKTEMPQFVKDYMEKAKAYSYDKLGEFKTDFKSEIKVDANSLKSVKIISDLNEKYDKEYKQIIADADFSKYEERIKKINSDYENLKNEKDFLKKAKEINRLKKEIDALLDDYKKDKEKLSLLVKDSTQLYKDINTAKKEDLDRLMSMAKLPSLDKEKITESLLGQDTYEKINKALTIGKQAVKYIPDDPKKKVFSQKTRRGRIVQFVKLENYPKFLLKKASVDGVFTPDNQIAYSGTITNITNQPQLYPYPLMVEIKGAKDKASLYFKFLAYLYKEPMETETFFKYEGAKIAKKEFGSEGSLKITVEKANADTQLKLKTVSNNIDGLWSTYFTGVYIKPETEKIKFTPLKNSIEKSFSSLTSFKTEVYLNGTFSSPDIKLKTDLAEILNESLKKAFGDEYDKARKEIESQIDEKIKENKERLDKLIKENQDKIQGKLKDNESKILNWKKDLEEKLKKSSVDKLPNLNKIPKIKI
jgi:uncharacterized protein (TIGR03545 family)